MLKVEQVYKEYRKNPVLQNITFELPAAGVASLVGPNGSGKTTLLNCISGLLAVNSGSIQINEKEIQSQEDTFGLVSYFFDDRVLLQDLSGWEHLLLLDSAQRQRADRYIRLFGAEDFLKKKVKKYSLGMKQILLIILTRMMSDSFADTSVRFLEENITLQEDQYEQQQKELAKDTLSASTREDFEQNLLFRESMLEKYRGQLSAIQLGDAERYWATQKAINEEWLQSESDLTLEIYETM